MKVLIIKTSSMGDIIHTLPALTDAGNVLSSATFDWVVEENFIEIPKWHPLVNNVIPVALRRWRKNLFSSQTLKQIRDFHQEVSAEKYDLVIDAQGLLKSALLACMTHGLRCGGDWNSAREHLASIFYQRKLNVPRQQHAITRMRSLFAQALGYTLPESVPNYGIDRAQFFQENTAENYLVFLHGTTWPTKHWPEEHWKSLAKLANQQGFLVKLPWGNLVEKERAERIAASCDHAQVLPKLNLLGIAQELAGAKAVVSVDTGLGHLTAALDVPAVSLYGPTDPNLIGALGRSQKHLSATLVCQHCSQVHCAHEKSSTFQPSDMAILLPPVVWKEVLVIAY